MTYLTTVLSFDTLALLGTLAYLIFLFIQDYKDQKEYRSSNPLCVKRSLAFQKVAKRNF